MFDPTPRLKSSPIPINFISFNRCDDKCIYCGKKYIEALFCKTQKYCKKCLSSYINDITDNNTYLDVYYTMDLKTCEISRKKVPQSIQECYKNCLIILCFKQIYEDYIDYNYGCYGLDKFSLYNDFIEKETYCNLCGKTLYQGIDLNFKLCSDCYLVSYERIESTLIKNQITILYLPLWYNNPYCDVCNSKLEFKSDCQKYCVNCFIHYVGCRYCLTTNIIFGLTDQSQCKKCKRVSFILDNKADTFLIYNMYDDIKLPEIENMVKHNDNCFTPRQILEYIKIEQIIKWIPYSQFTSVKEMTKGGYGIIYKAKWLGITVILKRFENSKNNCKYFLNELKSNQHFFTKYDDTHIIKIYGLTKDPELEDYVLVMEYASGGDLHKYLQNNFTDISWNRKIDILSEISSGLNYVHKHGLIHRDFHSGNILNKTSSYFNFIEDWKIGDLGLSQPVNNTSSNSEIYGVIPYIAPEIFKGFAFSKEADIYSFGMIMWELTTGCKPFANVNHDIHLIYKILDGERPKITKDTPECYANLMKSCWDPDPKKRPSITKIFGSLDIFINNSYINFKIFNQAEAKRFELMRSRKIGPEFAEKCHSGAIYTSRPLSALISECSSTHSTTISFGNKEDYNYTSKEQDLDIDTESSSSQNLTIQNSSVSLKKRNIEELNFDRDKIVGKRIKISSLIN